MNKNSKKLLEPDIGMQNNLSKWTKISVSECKNRRELGIFGVKCLKTDGFDAKTSWNEWKFIGKSDLPLEILYFIYKDDILIFKTYIVGVIMSSIVPILDCLRLVYKIPQKVILLPWCLCDMVQESSSYEWIFYIYTQITLT